MNFVSKLHVDVCIIGASGILTENGITNPYSMHSELQRKIIEASDYRILLADHSKFGKIAAEKAADLSEINLIITDSGLDNAVIEKYSKYTDIVIS